MNHLIKISVIVPVFNVEKFIKKNVDSLLKQSFNNFEVIYVDDGSTDNSLQILKSYEIIDSRIRIIHNNNFGVSHTRNVGIEQALGEYITFIDGDDYVDEDYLEYLYSLVKDNNVNMAISLKHHINEDNRQDEKIFSEIRNSKDIIDDIYLNKIFMAVWNKIYSKNLILENNISFNEDIWYAEGMHFNIQCLSNVENVAVSNKKVYHYIANPQSAMRKGFNYKNEECALKSLDLQREILNNKGIKCKSLEYHYMMISYMIIKGIVFCNQIEENSCILKKSIMNIKTRRTIPFQVKLDIKLKIKWLIITLFPKLMLNIMIINRKIKNIY